MLMMYMDIYGGLREEVWWCLLLIGVSVFRQDRRTLKAAARRWVCCGRPARAVAVAAVVAGAAVAVEVAGLAGTAPGTAAAPAPSPACRTPAATPRRSPSRLSSPGRRQEEEEAEAAAALAARRMVARPRSTSWTGRSPRWA